MRSREAWKNAECCWESKAAVKGLSTVATSRLCGSKPRSTSVRRKKLLTRRPAPTSRISDRPISPADITPRRRCVPALTPKRSPPSLSASFTSAREVIKAGIRPNRNDARVIMAAEKPKIRGSRRTLAGRVAGIRSPRIFVAQRPVIDPSTPPIAASSKPSVSNCRASRRRPAPSAARTAISLPRTTLRESSKLATLAHAINRTKPTVPNRMRRRERTFCTSMSCSGITSTVSCARNCAACGGYSLSIS